jgi:hypothetical protein
VYPQGSHRNASNTQHRTAFAGPDANGNLFGVTSKGGIGQPAGTTASGSGVIFEMTPNQDGTWTYHVLQRFASYPTDGQIRAGGLVIDKSGNFYGSTLGAGSLGTEEVFKLSFTDGGWKKTVVYDFPNCNDGCGPVTTPVFDKAGNLYGEAAGGYNCGGGYCGTVEAYPTKERQVELHLAAQVQPQPPASSPRVSLWTQRATCSALP